MKIKALIRATTTGALLFAAHSAQAQPDQDLFFIGKSARLESGRSVEAAVVIGDDLIVAGRVDGIAAAIGGDLHIVRGAHVDGAAVAIGGNLRVDPGATLDGARVEVPGGDFSKVIQDLSRFEPEHADRPGSVSGPAARLGQLFLLLVLGSLLVLLAPAYVRSAQRAIKAQPALAIATGLFAMLLIVPISVALVLSLVGIPLVVLVVVTFAGASLLGMTALALAMGEALPIPRRPKSPWAAMLLGVLVMALVAVLPFVGAAMAILATMISVGGALLSRFGTKRFDSELPKPFERGGSERPPYGTASTAEG